ncbi:PH domain leucine-rich repeat-containing protein phosphatase 1-like, partial [Loxodonta africana]|uniref:PH domain leucine-rich repeat-containing protein phosphatase 1-like n=2 Tax=Elephantidae TaxID=9780 RepID=UPI0030D04BCF
METAAAAQRLPEPGREDRAPASAAAAAAAAALVAAAGGGRSPEPALTSSGGHGRGARAEAPTDAQPGRASCTGRRRRRAAPQAPAGGAPLAPGASGANSLLLRRGRLKRNLSAAAAAASSSSAAAVSRSPGAAGLAASCSAAASLCTRSLDRKTLLLRHRQALQLQPSDRDWVRQQLRRGCVHVSDRHLAAAGLRPVLCTLDTTAAEVAARLLQPGHKGGGGVLKVLGRGTEPPCTPPARLPLPSGGAVDGAVARAASDAESFSLSPSAESVADRLDPSG